jgi:hypothetical protein
MTKQPHFATSLRLSKLCKWLFFVACIKLAVIGTLMWDGTLSGFSLQPPAPLSVAGIAPAASSKSEALATGNGAGGTVSSGGTASVAQPVAAVAQQRPVIAAS